MVWETCSHDTAWPRAVNLYISRLKGICKPSSKWGERGGCKDVSMRSFCLRPQRIYGTRCTHLLLFQKAAAASSLSLPCIIKSVIKPVAIRGSRAFSRSVVNFQKHQPPRFLEHLLLLLLHPTNTTSVKFTNLHPYPTIICMLHSTDYLFHLPNNSKALNRLLPDHASSKNLHNLLLRA